MSLVFRFLISPPLPLRISDFKVSMISFYSFLIFSDLFKASLNHFISSYEARNFFSSIIDPDVRFDFGYLASMVFQSRFVSIKSIFNFDFYLRIVDFEVVSFFLSSFDEQIDISDPHLEVFC